MEDQKTIQNDVMDKIKLEGVLSMGYGAIPKAVMVDPDLPLNSKSLYAYLCSFSGGNQNSVTISRNKILANLNYSKDTHYNCLKPLVDSGIINIKQETQNGMLAGNIYTLISNVKKYENVDDLKNESPDIPYIYSMLKTQDVRKDGYGIIPKVVMVSSKLSIKSKALYAYICSFAGNGSGAFPYVKNILYHLGITQNSYRKYLKELLDYNCLSVGQRIEINGTFGPNDYYINSFTDLETPNSKEKCLIYIKKKGQPSLKNPDTVNQDTVQPSLKNPDTVNQDTDTTLLHQPLRNITINNNLPSLKNPDTAKPDMTKPDMTKPDIYNNSLNNNSLNKNSLSINQDRPTEFFDIKKKFLDGIDAEIYNPKNPMNEDFSEKEKENQKDVYMKIQGIGSLIAQTLSRPDEYITIGKNKIPMEEVYDRFMSLNLFHIEKVVFTLMKTPTEIKNPTQYLLTALFNAPNEDIFFRNK